MQPEVLEAFQLLLKQMIKQRRDQAQTMGYAETQTRRSVLVMLKSIRESLRGTVPELDALISEFEQEYRVGTWQ